MYTIQTLYAALMALAVLIGISLALTLTIEGAGILWLRAEIRDFLERSRVPSPTRTPSAGAAQLPTPTEEERVLELR